MNSVPTPDATQLIAVATAAASNAYAPYSGFRVGAALLLSNGEVVTGVNVENAAYGSTICAERSALVAAVSRFGPTIRVKAVAIANLNNAASSPCGACRQMLAEFCPPDAPVSFPAEDETKTMMMQALLPEMFLLRGEGK